MNLSTPMMGLRLAHPFVAGASPLGRQLDNVKRMEDGGAAAIVLPSMFEEQVTMAEEGRIHHHDIRMRRVMQDSTHGLAAFGLRALGDRTGIDDADIGLGTVLDNGIASGRKGRTDRRRLRL